MGTLSDITAQASNTLIRRFPLSFGYQPLHSPAGMEKENVGKTRSPHFMTPTFSSKQSVAANGKSEGSSAWMKTAAKRVGLHRTGDGTPRSRKETRAKQTRTISFPDKVGSSSQGIAVIYPTLTHKAVRNAISRQGNRLFQPIITGKTGNQGVAK